MRIRRTWKITTRAEWDALALEDKEALVADDDYRQDTIREVRDAISDNEKGGPMDAAWAVLLFLESL